MERQQQKQVLRLRLRMTLNVKDGSRGARIEYPTHRKESDEWGTRFVTYYS
jgi:hypothetical protein